MPSPMIGLLWLELDPARPLAQSVALAAAAHRRRYGTVPDTCYVHPSALADGPMMVDVVRVMGKGNVLRQHFWVGVEERSKLARRIREWREQERSKKDAV